MLLILEGIAREEINYNTKFSKDEVTNMEVLEEEDKERIKRMIKNKGMQIVKQQKHNKKKVNMESHNEIYLTLEK